MIGIWNVNLTEIKMCEILKMEICKLIFWSTALLFLNVFNEGVNKSTNNKQIYSSS